MTRHASLFGIALCCCASASIADYRIRTQPYDAEQIVRVSGRPGIQSTIEFAPDERIENIAVGNSAAWEVTPNRRASLIFLKPLVSTSRSNMTVVTDRRTYMFDLIASSRGAALYSLKFSYPKEEIRQAVTPVPPQAPAAAPVTSSAVPLLRPAEFNFAWTSKGSPNLLPERIFDDGQSLYLAWRHNDLLPAIMTLSDDRKEATLNYRVDGDYIVVSPIPANILLRYADKQASVWPSAKARAFGRAHQTTALSLEAAAIARPAAAPRLVAPGVTVNRAAAPGTAPMNVQNAQVQEVTATQVAKIAYPKFEPNDNLAGAVNDK
jgi:type IV secretion system protein VirB9